MNTDTIHTNINTDTGKNQGVHSYIYDETMPLISVVMPSYNSAQTITKAVLSCINQSYPNVEIIIVDNGSADNTAAVAKALCRQYYFVMPDKSLRPRIRLIVQDNKGVSAARNIGIREAQGEWLMSLDSDDYYEPETIETMYAAVCTALAAGKEDRSKSIQTAVSVCGIRKVWEGDSERNLDFLPDAFTGTLKSFTDKALTRLYDLNLIGTHSNKLYSTGLIRDKAIYYNEELQVNEDLDFVLRYMAHCDYVKVVPQIFLNYVQHDKGQSLINTFQPHGLKGALIVLGSCNALFEAADTCKATVEAMDRRLFVHICSFAGLMYYRSGYDRDTIKSELRRLCENADFCILLDRLKADCLKDRLAQFLLKHRLTGIYDGICRKIYKNKD